MQEFDKEVVMPQSDSSLDKEKLTAIEGDTHFNLLQEIFDKITQAVDVYGPQSPQYLVGRKTYCQKLLDFWILKMRAFQYKKALGMVQDHLHGERYVDGPHRVTVYSHETPFSFYIDSEELTQKTLNIVSEFYPDGENWVIIDSFKCRFLNGELDELESPKISSSKQAHSWSSEGDIFFNVSLREGGLYHINRTEILPGGVINTREIRHNGNFIIE